MNFISKKYKAWKLNRMQKKVDKAFKEQGFTDQILEEQIVINKKSKELDIPDPNTLNDKGWAQ